jgi:predicted NBD/HSP70 family sugar kinase
MIAAGADSILSRRERTVENLVEAARQGDRVARDVLGETGGYLGVAVASLLNLLNPAIVVVGGPLVGAGDLLLGRIRDTVHHRSLWRSVAEARIVTSELGDSAIAVGAATLVLQSALKSPVLFSTPQVARAV